MLSSVTEKEVKWHYLSDADVLELLKTNASTGLSSDEVQHRRAIFGKNVLTPKKGRSAWIMFLLQFHQPLIYILLVSAVITLALGEFVDSGVIFGVVLINAIVGFLQEAKALKALDALAKSMTTQTSVVRDGLEQVIPSTDLVPGDIIRVGSGDRIPADTRLIKVRDLLVNESALTGESVPVEKKTVSLEEGTALADRKNMAYTSSLVTYGRAEAVVTTTGDRTEVGRISGLISSADELATPLTKKISHFSRLLLFIILGMAVLTFIVGILRGQPWEDTFMAAVALAVGAIPEGLPAAVTITLAIGVGRMARRRAIIRKLTAVETLGSTMVICSDKTGTLTENQMTVQEVFSGGGIFIVSGAGYHPKGIFSHDGKTIDVSVHHELKECLIAGLLCNTSRLVEENGRFEIEGDPTEGALIVSAQKANITEDGLGEIAQKIDILPFESEHQYMATLHNSPQTRDRVIYMKGSVERVLERCDSSFDRSEALLHAEKMASRGLRVLAFAMKRVPSVAGTVQHEDLKDMKFLGFQGMIDPPRVEAISAVKKCHSAGIRVKMITGDHELTALAIASQLGLRRSPNDSDTELMVFSGMQLEEMNDVEFSEAAERGSVFARVTPEQKIRLVRALQASGNIVAMTGDGVNDAPALKQANIGIAMGISGTEVSKEAADMVLTDDNFASIEAAVEEGRCVYDNLKKFIVWSLPTNLSEGLVILLAIFLGTELPILPVQILWVNMTTAIFLGMMLAFEPKEPGIMQRPPQNPKLPIMTTDIILRTLYMSFMLVAMVFGLFKYALYQGASIGEARSVATTMLVMGELFYLFSCRSLTRSVLSVGLFSNMWIWVGCMAMITAQILFTQTTFMNRMFHTAPIPLLEWEEIILASLIIMTVVGIEKLWRRRNPSVDKF